MAGKFLNALSGFSSNVLDGIRAKNNERLDDAAFEERVVGIKNATAALLHGTSTIHIELQSKGVIVSAYNKLNNQLHLFVASTPCSFSKYYYDLSSAVDGIKNAISCYQKEFENISTDNILEIYHGRTNWKHDGGNTHRWSQSKPYCQTANYSRE